MRKVRIRQTASAAWAADSTIGVDLERVGLVTRIDMTVEVTPSATLDGANQPDGIFRMIENMRVVGGAHTYFNLPADDGGQGGVLLHYKNMVDGSGPGHEGGDVAAPSASYVPVNFVYHCGTRKRDGYGRDNPFDLSAFVPAFNEAQLRAEWTVAGNDVLDDTVTITSAVMRFTLARVLGSHAEIQAEQLAQGVTAVLPSDPGVTGMVPAWSARGHAIGGTSSDFESETEDVVLGGYLHTVWLLTQDATTTRTLRAADEVSEVRISVPIRNETILQMGLETYLSDMPYAAATIADDVVEDFGNVAPHGIMPLRLHAHGNGPTEREFGLDFRRLQTGAVKLGMIVDNNAAGDDALILYERYQTYNDRLG